MLLSASIRPQAITAAAASMQSQRLVNSGQAASRGVLESDAEGAEEAGQLVMASLSPESLALYLWLLDLLVEVTFGPKLNYSRRLFS